MGTKNSSWLRERNSDASRLSPDGPPLKSAEDPPEQVVISLATPCCAPVHVRERWKEICGNFQMPFEEKQKRRASSFCQREGAAALSEAFRK